MAKAAIISALVLRGVPGGIEGDIPQSGPISTTGRLPGYPRCEARAPGKFPAAARDGINERFEGLEIAIADPIFSYEGRNAH